MDADAGVLAELVTEGGAGSVRRLVWRAASVAFSACGMSRLGPRDAMGRLRWFQGTHVSMSVGRFHDRACGRAAHPAFLSAQNSAAAEEACFAAPAGNPDCPAVRTRRL